MFSLLTQANWTLFWNYILLASKLLQHLSHKFDHFVLKRATFTRVARGQTNQILNDQGLSVTRDSYYVYYSTEYPHTTISSTRFYSLGTPVYKGADWTNMF